MEIAGPTSYADILRERVAEIDNHLSKLESDLRAGRMTGDEYARRLTSLKQTRIVLQHELQRLGVVH